MYLKIDGSNILYSSTILKNYLVLQCVGLRTLACEGQWLTLGVFWLTLPLRIVRGRALS